MIKSQLYTGTNDGGTTTVTLELQDDGSLQVFYYDVGKAAMQAFGDSDYESWLTIPASHVPDLCFKLLERELAGQHGALTVLKQFCEKHAISHDHQVWT